LSRPCPVASLVQAFTRRRRPWGRGKQNQKHGEGRTLLRRNEQTTFALLVHAQTL
jgi:hypothetical protein